MITVMPHGPGEIGFQTLKAAEAEAHMRLSVPRATEATGRWNVSLDRDDAVADSCAQVLEMMSSSWPLRARHSASSAEHAVPSDASARDAQKNTTSVERIEARCLR